MAMTLVIAKSGLGNLIHVRWAGRICRGPKANMQRSFVHFTNQYDDYGTRVLLVNTHLASGTDCTKRACVYRMFDASFSASAKPAQLVWRRDRECLGVVGFTPGEAIQRGRTLKAPRKIMGESSTFDPLSD